MDWEQKKQIMLAKADQMFDSIWPGFIHARREFLSHENWVKLTFPSGFSCTSNTTPGEAELMYNEIFGKKEYLDPDIEIIDGSTILDVGANLGMFTMYLQKNFKELTIHAVEPVPATFEVLKINVADKENSITLLHNIAMGSKENSTLDIDYYPVLTGNSTSYPELKKLEREGMSQFFTKEEMDYIFSHKRIQVPCSTLSAIIDENNIESIDLVKIDTEGAEIEILCGIRPDHWARIKQFVFEIHNEKETLPAVTGILKKNGYRIKINEESRDFSGNVIISAIGK